MTLAPGYYYKADPPPATFPCWSGHLTCFEEDDLVVLGQLHEALDPLGKLHNVLNGVRDLDGTFLPHVFAALWENRDREKASTLWRPGKKNQKTNWAKQWRKPIFKSDKNLCFGKYVD